MIDFSRAQGPTSAHSSVAGRIHCPTAVYPMPAVPVAMVWVAGRAAEQAGKVVMAKRREIPGHAAVVWARNPRARRYGARAHS